MAGRISINRSKPSDRRWMVQNRPGGGKLAVVAPWPEMGKLAGALGEGPMGYGFTSRGHREIEESKANLAR